jgi:hypothetical protein
MIAQLIFLVVRLPYLIVLTLRKQYHTLLRIEICSSKSAEYKEKSVRKFDLKLDTNE